MLCEKYKRKILPGECHWYSCRYWIGNGGLCFNGRFCFTPSEEVFQSTS
ncbi:hypothetical protein GACE_0442 [Geoglobus acetivorans]|uniref:Uncharacterized protein n=1 Tax=Geoglobus acetivorans TaxID=565033 RepID=A0A0A7GBS3_GEOAI|nr:hypothetical protein GACE_0442 [Geoglobus acetivorans]